MIQINNGSRAFFKKLGQQKSVHYLFFVMRSFTITCDVYPYTSLYDGKYGIIKLLYPIRIGKNAGEYICKIFSVKNK